MWTTGFQKGPHRRCFKTSSLFRLAGRATGAVRSRYRTEPPTFREAGGRPQARATLGSGDIGMFAPPINRFLPRDLQLFGGELNGTDFIV